MYLDGQIEPDAETEKLINKYIECLQQIPVNPAQIGQDRLDACEDAIREISISVFFSGVQPMTPSVQRKPLSRMVEVKSQWLSHYLPILIMKRRLPENDGDDLIDIAKNFGFVSKDDPKQGIYGRTTDEYCLYEV